MAADIDRIKKNIGLLLEKAAKLHSFTNGRDAFSADEITILNVRCAEITLLALATSDDADSLPLLTDGLLWGEIAMCLKQIAYHSLSIQDWEAGIEGEVFSSLLLSEHVKQIDAHAAHIGAYLGIIYGEKQKRRRKKQRARQCDSKSFIEKLSRLCIRILTPTRQMRKRPSLSERLMPIKPAT